MVLRACVKKGGRYLFVHHAISDTLTHTGQSTNIFNEVVLPRKELSELFSLTFGGHIHLKDTIGNIVVAGSVMTAEVGEREKFVWLLDVQSDGHSIKKIPLPVRPIIRLENPELIDLKKIPSGCILKIVFTEKSEHSVQDFRKAAELADACAVLEQYPSKRQRELPQTERSPVDMSIEDLLRLYAQQRKVDEIKLLSAWEHVKP